MINIELALELAKKYGFEVNRVEAGKGGMFYINENHQKIKIKDLSFDDELDTGSYLSLATNEDYEIFEFEKEMLTFAA
jgi:hypothetical protein